MLIKTTRSKKNPLKLAIPLCLGLLLGYAVPTLSIADDDAEIVQETPDKSNGNSGNNGNNASKNKQHDDSTNDNPKNPIANKEEAGSKPICSKTAQNLFNACRHTATANKWLGASFCFTVNDPVERHACNKSYMAVWAEAKKDCKNERSYRRDTCDVLGESRYQGWAGVDFMMDAETPITGNTYFPLIAETRLLASDNTTINREVTNTIRAVDGVDCKVVIEEERDTNSNVLIERRELLFAQDISNNVWACGALHQHYEVLDEGQPAVVVGTEGSWQSGSNGALAGLVMPAGEPAYGTVFRRNYAPGVQEVTAEVIDPASIETGIACEANCSILRATSAALPAGYYDEYYTGGTGFVFGENQDGEEVIQQAP